MQPESNAFKHTDSPSQELSKPASKEPSEQQRVQHQVQQHQLLLHRQNSNKFSNHIHNRKNDLESKINRL